MNILVLNGHVACLKTTLGYHLAPALGLAHVTTSVMGDFISDEEAPDFLAMRDARYNLATAVTAKYLELGVSVVLDGTFAKRSWREAVYHLADQYAVEEVVALTCVCSDPTSIERRLRHRRLRADSPDGQANQWAAYIGSVRTFEGLEEDILRSGRRPARLQFDSGTFTIRHQGQSTPYSRNVATAVERIVASGRLSRPQFGLDTSGGRSWTASRLLVALEGVGGAGKSTQTEYIGNRMAAEGRRTYVFREFSDGPLGRLLSEQALGGDSPWVCSREDDRTHLESLIVIGDALTRARMTLERRLSGEARYDVILADRYTWSHLAHALALLPETAPKEVLEAVSAATSELISPLQTLADSYCVIYLRIAVEVAAGRIESRLGRKLSPKSRHFLSRLGGMLDRFADLGGATIVEADAPRERVTDGIVAAIEALLRKP